MAEDTSPAPPADVLFISHGAPTIAIEEDTYTAALRRAGAALPRARAFLVVSAHWEARAPFRVTTAARPETIHDFSGFPEELYRLTYPAPGDPALAEEAAGLLAGAGLPCEADPARGLDHGAWVPLRFFAPAADVPVVQLSLPVPRDPQLLLATGRALAPLRRHGVVLVGSGGVVHNLSLLRWGEKEAPAEGWATAFDSWVWDAVRRFDIGGAALYAQGAPEARRAVPTTEHFDPLFVVLGSVLPGDVARTLFAGFHYGNLSMRSFALSPG